MRLSENLVRVKTRIPNVFTKSDCPIKKLLRILLMLVFLALPVRLSDESNGAIRR